MTHFYAHPAALVDAAGRSVKLQITAADSRHEIIGDPMSRSVLSTIATAAIAASCFASAARASNADLEEAITLLKQMHADQCQQQKLRGQVMLAHRSHDEESLNELWPQIESISKRLKPAEDKLNLLKANIKKNPDEQSAFETALLRESNCD